MNAQIVINLGEMTLRICHAACIASQMTAWVALIIELSALVAIAKRLEAHQANAQFPSAYEHPPFWQLSSPSNEEAKYSTTNTHTASETSHRQCSNHATMSALYTDRVACDSASGARMVFPGVADLQDRTGEGTAGGYLGLERTRVGTGRGYLGFDRAGEGTAGRYLGQDRTAEGTTRGYLSQYRTGEGTAGGYLGLERTTEGTAGGYLGQDRTCEGTGRGYLGFDRTGEGAAGEYLGRDRTGEGSAGENLGRDRTGEGSAGEYLGRDRTREGTAVGYLGLERTGEGTAGGYLGLGTPCLPCTSVPTPPPCEILQEDWLVYKQSMDVPNHLQQVIVNEVHEQRHTWRARNPAQAPASEFAANMRRLLTRVMSVHIPRMHPADAALLCKRLQASFAAGESADDVDASSLMAPFQLVTGILRSVIQDTARSIRVQPMVSSASGFEIKYLFFGIMLFLVMKINNFRGNLTDIPAIE